MRPSLRLGSFLLATLVLATAAEARQGTKASAPEGMVVIGPGILRPLFPPEEGLTEVSVPAFALDVAPVTNAQYQRFVEGNARWQKGRVPKILGGERYLQHWTGPADRGPAAADAPVVFVTWFAAKAYCEAQGKRLPTEVEWELAAAADETQADARESDEWKRRILEWYARPAPKQLPPVKAGRPNFYGVHDLHGLVWEWVHDFNNNVISSDSRTGDDGDRLSFCGAGAVQAGEKSDYASFMRYAFRNSLEGRYTGASLGFRCAADLPGRKP